MKKPNLSKTRHNAANTTLLVGMCLSTARRTLCLRLAASVSGLFLAGCLASTDTPEVKFERATLLFDRDRYEEAIPLYSEAIKAWPNEPEVLFSRGLCYERLELHERALEDYAACLKIDSEHVDARNNKGVVLAKLDRYEDAAAEFTQLIQLQPDNMLALRNRGLCYHDLQKFDLALADYNVAVAQSPDDVNNWFQRGNVHLEQKHFDKAVADYSQAIAVDREFSRAWMNRGVAHYGLNNRDQAMKDLQEAQRLNSDIVLPAIDWTNEDTFTEAAPALEMTPVTDVVAAKPVLDALPEDAQSWAAALAFAREQLEERGYSDMTVVDNFPPHRCARIQATQDNTATSVYVAEKQREEGVVLPAVSSDNQSLLVLQLAKDSEPLRYQVATFVKDWQLRDDAWTSVLIRVPLSHSPD